MLHRCRWPLCAGLAAILIAAAATALPAAAQTALPPVVAPQADAFTVSGVKVDISAANAAAARDQAIVEAQSKAWDTLYQRLVPGARTAPRLSEVDLARLVRGFEIDEEKVSATRYVGSLTVSFRPQAVRDQLSTTGAAYVEPPAQPLVVLPVAAVAGRPVLWDDRTRWRDAWEARERGSSLVPLVLPEGELEDIQAIGVEDALSGAPEPLAAIARRYNANGVVVARTDLPESGEPSRGEGVVVDVTRYGLDGTREQQQVTVKADPNDRPGDVLARAVSYVSAALDEGWRRENTVASGPEQTVAVAVPVTRLEDWVEATKRLMGINALTRVDVVSLSRTEGVLNLSYRGDVERLRQALARKDLGLSPAAPRYDAGGMQGVTPALEMRVLPPGGGARLSATPLPASLGAPAPTTAPSPYGGQPGVIMGAPPRPLGTLPAQPGLSGQPPARY